MIENHERIEELLAGYVLRSLSGEDAVEADRLLSDHVPTCASCRDALAGFQAVTADLALDVTPLSPPDTLLPRLHRELEPSGGRRRPARMFAVAASVVVVAGLAGLSVTQGLRAHHSDQRADALKNAISLASQPDANLVPVGPATEITAPGREVLYLYGTGVTPPSPGMVYRVYLVAGTNPTFVAQFQPDAGFVLVEIPFDAAAYDGLWVCTEPEASSPTCTQDQADWRAAS